MAHAGQLSALVTPGRLSRPHAVIEGLNNCQKCHEAGRKVSAERCLTCHKPIADRIAGRVGVHRAVKGECASCHAEHQGVDGDLRHIDVGTFRHAEETGLPLDGRHAKVAANCAACHKGHSFLDARTACSSCHADPHKGTVGSDCSRCHTVSAAFTDARRQFDHGVARFQLTGKHQVVACEKCHDHGVLRGLVFQTCSACHQDPHRNKFGTSCTSCHATDQWITRTIEHSKTDFPLVGAHATVACAKCHVTKPIAPLRFDKCSTCHENVHRDSIKDDCRSCHSETTFKAATVDHAARARFPLVDKHAGVACSRCHARVSPVTGSAAFRVVDFGGATTACVSCHSDPHQSAFGTRCEACHRPTTFKVARFAHPRSPEFFAGQHAGLDCARCHAPDVPFLQPVRTGRPTAVPRLASPPMECRTCHSDVHLGQLGTACERCHTVEGAKFAATAFSHDRGAFPLTGKHQTTECVKCHSSTTGVFPAGAGQATLFAGVATACASCHKDPHLGQLAPTCNSCHSTDSFKVTAYVHKGLERLFGDFHGRLPCQSCHKLQTGRFPAGLGTSVRYKVGRECQDCHPQF